MEADAGPTLLQALIVGRNKFADRSHKADRDATVVARPQPRAQVPAQPPSVTSVVGVHGTIVCTEKSTLGSAAAQMLARHRSFAIVAHCDGTMFAALTENDILHAYASGVPGSFSVGAWLMSGFAMLRDLEHVRTVRPDATLLEAARVMLEQNESEFVESDFACRHVVICDGNRKNRRGIVSCLDIVRYFHAFPSILDPAGRLSQLTVRDVMKPLSKVPTCTQRRSVMQAMQKMIALKQNFVVVHNSDDLHDAYDAYADHKVVKHVRGIVTTRDTLRAFVDHAGGNVTLDAWLHRLEGINSRFVQADLPLAAVVRKMASEDFHHVVVVDNDNVLIGAVSSSDVVHTLARVLVRSA